MRFLISIFLLLINKEHIIVDNELQWTINNYTLIEEVLPTEGEKQNCSMYKYNFHQLDDLEKYINSDAQLGKILIIFFYSAYFYFQNIYIEHILFVDM